MPSGKHYFIPCEWCGSETFESSTEAEIGDLHGYLLRCEKCRKETFVHYGKVEEQEDDAEIQDDFCIIKRATDT